MSEVIHIIEIGPRDGLQNERTAVSVDDRIALVERLGRCRSAHRRNRRLRLDQGESEDGWIG